MIKTLTILITFLIASVFVPRAAASASCEPFLDGNTWNLACSADAGDSGDDYQCDYFLALSYSQGESDQQEATGAVTPGQSGVIIWSEDVNGDGSDTITSVSVASGSCSQ